MNLSHLILLAGLTASSAHAATCDKATAVTHGRAVSDAIVKINGQNPSRGLTDSPVVEDANYFYVTTSYDTGLSVPTYTVKVLKYNCDVLDVTYSNREG